MGRRPSNQTADGREAGLWRPVKPLVWEKMTQWSELAAVTDSFIVSYNMTAMNKIYLFIFISEVFC